MKYIITTYMPCTAEEYIVLKDDIDYKNFQVRVSLFLSPNPTSQDTVRAAWGRGGMKRRAFSTFPLRPPLSPNRVPGTL